ncbi:MAG TPA: DUF1287 domain-containing protein [Candidatus Ozemobacteraceae bacterium]|nr:DUF1287 domain-containing protein [Candidatus Ozemobacteraceae bacterium]HQG27538.1 DUF1287 domain-containing protein [Candidatus Ozemobacteraceae bacterium]
MRTRSRWLFLLPALSLLLLNASGVGLWAASRLPGPLSLERFLESAMLQTRLTLFYDPSYVKLPYPSGDVPIERGVCTDVIVRAFRAVGVDLQKLVHEDMKRHFRLYPKRWGLTRPDPNIDHRRVPNLETFFSRHGMKIADLSPASFRKGDLVVWNLPGGLPHIGIVATDPATGSPRPLCIHNVGAGTRLEDVLVEWPITAHYRCDFK